MSHVVEMAGLGRWLPSAVTTRRQRSQLSCIRMPSPYRWSLNGVECDEGWTVVGGCSCRVVVGAWQMIGIDSYGLLWCVKHD
jgi:hypothetical protein